MIMNGRIPSAEDIEAIRSTFSQEPPAEEADASLNHLIQTLGNLDDMASALDTKLDGLLSSLDDILKGLGPWNDGSVGEVRSGESDGESEKVDDALLAPPPTESSVEQEAEQSNTSKVDSKTELPEVNPAIVGTLEKAGDETDSDLSRTANMPPQLSETTPEQNHLPSDIITNDEKATEA